MGKPYDKRDNADIVRATSWAIDGMSYQAIAKAMGKTPEQIEGKVKAGLRRISMSLSDARKDKENAITILRQDQS
jgi:hypothetical protein